MSLLLLLAILVVAAQAINFKQAGIPRTDCPLTKILALRPTAGTTDAWRRACLGKGNEHRANSGAYILGKVFEAMMAKDNQDGIEGIGFDDRVGEMPFILPGSIRLDFDRFYNLKKVKVQNISSHQLNYEQLRYLDPRSTSKLWESMRKQEHLRGEWKGAGNRSFDMDLSVLSSKKYYFHDFKVDKAQKAYQRMYCLDVMYATMVLNPVDFRNMFNTGNIFGHINSRNGNNVLTEVHAKELCSRRFNNVVPANPTKELKYFRLDCLHNGGNGYIFNEQDRLTGLLMTTTLFTERNIQMHPLGFESFWKLRFSVPFQRTLFNDVDRFVWTMNPVYRTERRNRWTIITCGNNRFAKSISSSCYANLRDVIEMSVAISGLRFMQKVFNSSTWTMTTGTGAGANQKYYRSIRQSFRMRTKKYGFGDEVNLGLGGHSNSHWQHFLVCKTGKMNKKMQDTYNMSNNDIAAAVDDRKTHGKNKFWSRHLGMRKAWTRGNIINRKVPAERARWWLQGYMNTLVARCTSYYFELKALEDSAKRVGGLSWVDRMSRYGKDLLRGRLSADISRGFTSTDTPLSGEIKKYYKQTGELMAFWLTYPVDALLNRDKMNTSLGYRDTRAAGCKQIQQIVHFIQRSVDAQTVQKHLAKHPFLQKFLKQNGYKKRGWWKGGVATKKTIRKALSQVKAMFCNAWMIRIGGEEEIKVAPEKEEDINVDIGKDEGMALPSVSEETAASVAVEEPEKLYVVMARQGMHGLGFESVIKGRLGADGITCHFGTFPTTSVQALGLGPGTEVGYNGALATVQGTSTMTDGEWFNIVQNGQTHLVPFKAIDIHKRNLGLRGPGQTEPYVHNTGMGNTMKIGILLFVVILVLSALAGMYLYFQDEEELDTDFVDLEAGFGPRRPAPERKERPNEQFHMSGKELKEVVKDAKSRKPRRSRRKMKRSASRSRSRLERSRKSRRPRGSRRPRRQRSRLGPRVRV